MFLGRFPRPSAWADLGAPFRRAMPHNEQPPALRIPKSQLVKNLRISGLSFGTYPQADLHATEALTAYGPQRVLPQTSIRPAGASCCARPKGAKPVSAEITKSEVSSLRGGSDEGSRRRSPSLSRVIASGPPGYAGLLLKGSHPPLHRH
jgi:hypothetical protein